MTPPQEGISASDSPVDTATAPDQTTTEPSEAENDAEEEPVLRPLQRAFMDAFPLLDNLPSWSVLSMLLCLTLDSAVTLDEYQGQGVNAMAVGCQNGEVLLQWDRGGMVICRLDG